MTTGDLEKTIDMKEEEEGETAGMRNRKETGKKETGEDTRIDETGVGTVIPEGETVPGSIEKEDRVPKA